MGEEDVNYKGNVVVRTIDENIVRELYKRLNVKEVEERSIERWKTGDSPTWEILGISQETFDEFVRLFNSVMSYAFSMRTKLEAVFTLMRFMFGASRDFDKEPPTVREVLTMYCLYSLAFYSLRSRFRKELVGLPVTMSPVVVPFMAEELEEESRNGYI